MYGCDGFPSVRRFSAVQEPTDAWAVFDDILGVPVAIAGTIQIGLLEKEAGLVAEKLNALADATPVSFAID